MISKEITKWDKGTVDAPGVDASQIRPGAISNSLNFLTRGGRMELRRGTHIIGTDQGAGGSVGGIGVGTNLDSDGTQVIFRKRNGTQKFEYYDETTSDWLETGTDACPVAAQSEDFEFATYGSPAGAQAYWSSPLSSIYKIMVANPGSITDLLSTVYRGYIRIKQSRMFLWHKNSASGGSAHDEQNLYLSYIDGQAYTTVSGEALVDCAAGTLAFKAGGSKRTCFGVVITHTASGETFTDNRDGTLTGSISGTGTINYTTGAYTTTASGAGTADYQHETVTSTGIADFSFSGTRTAGQGDVLLQGDGGPIQAVESYGDAEYCAHELKTYALTLTADDTGATNLIFRDREGVPNHRAMKTTSIGIVYVNAIDPGQPQIKIIRLQRGSTAVDGELLSANIDLSGYSFDKAFVNEFEDWIIVGCRTLDSTVNNRFVLFNKIWKAFDIVDYWGLCADVYNGVMHIGESISANVVEIFSGTDDDGASIDGYCEINDWDLEYPGVLKKVKKLEIEGEIGPNQAIDVQVAIDDGPFVTVGQILGSGSYVDRSQSVDVGADTLGRHPVGGSSFPGDGITAYHYFRSMSLVLDKFERIKVRFESGIDMTDPTNPIDGLGYFAFSLVRFRDIRLKNQRVPEKYR